jgi:hypothetical protein
MTTLEELDAALLALPTNPVTDEDFTKRRELMTRRIELYNSIHNPPLEQQQATQHAGGLVEVIIPPGGPGAFAKKGGGYYYATEKDGRMVAMLPWATFHSLAFGVNRGAGPNGGMWLDYNPHLVDRLPQNPAPPPPAPYQEPRG